MSIIFDLLDAGYSVIPTKGKIPLIKYAELRGQRTTHDQVKAWWQQFKPCNFAILTGVEHGLVVVDADDSNAVEFIKSVVHATPMRVLTRRGCHYYFRHPGFKVSSRRVMDDPPIDIKADGGIVTAPGSTHESGFIYRLDDGADIYPVVDLPIYQKAWFPEKPIPIPAPRPKVNLDQAGRAQRYLDRIPAAGSGARNMQTYKAAVAMANDFGLDQDTTLALMDQWNHRNDPPLPERELRTIVESAAKGGRLPNGSKL